MVSIKSKKTGLPYTARQVLKSKRGKKYNQFLIQETGSVVYWYNLRTDYHLV